ncbi:hypothetical protein FN976_02335 [Caenimonas sedimenti]|uniref:DUF883 domain-containing protein n=1 Tax=Caenimonas sedimenti TaxID=2596921 RepID=A0A562ZXH8_9BURK|nr:hypothetical protein [Caenimonas sedimenti]TWO73096.1 hypothetical protein FN976_02335 [Caenimonas sedimenti]
MNTETSTNPFPTTLEQSSGGGSGLNGGGTAHLHKAAQKIHEAVDTLEQKLGQSSDKVMGLQQEYGDLAREQVRANPLAALGAAFAVGFIFAKVFSK